MNDPRRDVELRCDRCRRETLATDGCWAPQCWVCGGTRQIIVVHDHVLAYAETTALGYSIGPVGLGCTCGAIFDDYRSLADRTRQSINCPCRGAAPVVLRNDEPFRWMCTAPAERMAAIEEPIRSAAIDPPDLDDEVIIARAKSQLRRRAGAFPFGCESFKVAWRS